MTTQRKPRTRSTPPSAVRDIRRRVEAGEKLGEPEQAELFT